jgi:lipooligosaccharide transport system permease protein
MTLALPWPDLSLRALRLWQRNWDVLRNTWVEETVWPFVEPLVTLVALGLGLGRIVQLPGDESYLEFVAPGLLAIFPMWAATSEAGWSSYFRLESERIFDAVMATPLSVDDITTGEVLWAATRGLISTCFILVVIAAFGTVASPLALLVPLAAVPACIFFAAVSLCNTAVARSVRSLNYFFVLYITPQFWLSGAWFPLDGLPEWAQRLSWWVPSAHAAELFRGLVRGGLEWGHLGHLAWLAGAALLFYALALLLMRRRLVR